MHEQRQNAIIKKLLLLQGLTVAIPFIAFKLYALKIISIPIFGTLSVIAYSLSMYCFGLMGLFILLYTVIEKDSIDRPYRFLSYAQFAVSFLFYFFFSDTTVF